jgi:hypothetical protein
MTQLEIRLQTTEKEKIQKRTAALGMTTSDFIRQMCLYGFVVEYRTDVFHDVIKAINKIGTNINQIAKVCNETRNVSVAFLLFNIKFLSKENRGCYIASGGIDLFPLCKRISIVHHLTVILNITIIRLGVYFIS